MQIGIIGCGYVGRKAAKFWTDVGHIVSVTTRNSANIPNLSTVAAQVDLIKENNFNDFILNKDVLLISAAPAEGDSYRSTYLETAQSLSQALHRGHSLKQIIYTSSTSVYGDLKGGRAFESTPCRPENNNSAILCQTEQIYLDCSTATLNVCIFRLGEIIGPGRSIVDRLKCLTTPLPGTGEHLTNLIHVDDIIAALNFALSNKLNGIYNLCNDLHIPRKELYAHLCRQHGIPLPSWNPSLPQMHSSNKKVSNEKIKAAGFCFSHPTIET